MVGLIVTCRRDPKPNGTVDEAVHSNRLAVSLALRGRDAIVSAIECGRESSAALRNNLRSPFEHRLLDARAP